jgi:hypothetical protein
MDRKRPFISRYIKCRYIKKYCDNNYGRDCKNMYLPLFFIPLHTLNTNFLGTRILKLAILTQCKKIIKRIVKNCQTKGNLKEISSKIHKKANPNLKKNKPMVLTPSSL